MFIFINIYVYINIYIYIYLKISKVCTLMQYYFIIIIIIIITNKLYIAIIDTHSHHIYSRIQAELKKRSNIN